MITSKIEIKILRYIHKKWNEMKMKMEKVGTGITLFYGKYSN